MTPAQGPWQVADLGRGQALVSRSAQEGGGNGAQL